MLEIPGTTSYSKENRIEARDAAKCDQMPAMQRRGSGDLVEPAKKKEEGGPGARGLGQTGGQLGQLGQPGGREWGGGARPTMGTFQNVDWCDVVGLCSLPVVSLSCSSRVANPAGCKSCKSGSRTTVWHADGYANGTRKKGYAPGPNATLQHRDSFLTALVRSCVGRYHSLPPLLLLLLALPLPSFAADVSCCCRHHCCSDHCSCSAEGIVFCPAAAATAAAE